MTTDELITPIHLHNFSDTFATMSMITKQLKALLNEIEKKAKLIAVSKTKSAGEILEAYNAGQHAFGENYVQELVIKHPMLPSDIEWHFIGHLQSNKVKQIAPFVHYIHSVDSEKLLGEINKQAAKNNRMIKCLLQVHVAMEETKFGWEAAELMAFCAHTDFSQYSHLQLCGVMGMASFSDDLDLVRMEFKSIKICFETLKKTVFCDDIHFKEISMGMSGDWQLAVEEGSTMVRVGSAIFGARK